MKRMWTDALSTLFVVAGAVVVFAKLQSYDWWLIGSWKGALGVLAVLGLGILLTNITELVKLADTASFFETFAWLVVATVVIGSLSVTTTKLEFVTSGALIALGWVMQSTRHLWRVSHHHGSHYTAAHY
jgi:hypothetical protein